MSVQRIKIGMIDLHWSNWFSWNSIILDGRRKGSVKIPNKKPGVYEVRRNRHKNRLYIGKASNLRHRVRQALVKGKSPHTAGKKIRSKNNTSDLFVRWAETLRPAASEEELHRLHTKKFGDIPHYVKNK